MGGHKGSKGKGSVTGVGTGSVTQVSVVTANGISGTVANATTTPAITLNPSGLLVKASNLSDVADAATSNYNISGIKSVSQALTAAQIKNIFSSPISLASTFPAVAGKYWRIIECDINYIDGAAAFTNNLQCGCSTTAGEQFVVDLASLGGLGNTFIGVTDRRDSGSTVYAVNDYIHIHGQSDSATGNGTATLYITAQLITA